MPTSRREPINRNAMKQIKALEREAVGSVKPSPKKKKKGTDYFKGKRSGKSIENPSTRVKYW